MPSLIQVLFIGLDAPVKKGMDHEKNSMSLELCDRGDVLFWVGPNGPGLD
jgi:hypothetical protein